MTILPREPFLSSEKMLAALCVWREARGESRQAKLGVAHVLRNRCRMAPAQGFHSTVRENVLKPWAFSSFNADDPNSNLYPEGVNQVWQDCLAVVDSQEPDPTGGAVFYYSRPIESPPKAWGPVVITAIIDGLTFCALNMNPIS